MRLKVLIASLLAVVVALGIVGGVALAQQDTPATKTPPPVQQDKPDQDFVNELAKILGLDPGKVQDAVAQAKREVLAQHVDTMMRNRLNALVQSGKLTQADADTILDWWTSRPAAANTLLERLLESRGRGHVGPKRFGKAQGLPGLHAGMIAGTIASVDSANGQLTVNLMRGDTLTLRIDSTTIICLDGKPSTLDKLQSGEEVMVAYNPDNDTALRIMVWPSRPWRLHPSGSP